MEARRNTVVTGEATSPGDEATPSPFNEEFDKLVEDLLEEWHVPGIAIAVVDGDKTWTKGYGLADVAAKTPVTPNTVFCACSTTKAFTGAATAHLIDSGEYRDPSFPRRKVDWNTPIANIIPDDFVLQDEWATAHLTLEDALTHRSGMGGHQLAYGCENASVKSVVRALRHIPMSTPPRTTFQYSNLMYVAVSHAIETLTSRGLGDVFKDWFWKPLGMDETYFSPEDAAAAGASLAKGYYWDATKEAYIGVPYLPLKELTGDGAIMSSVHDYAKWIRALIEDDKFLSKAVHDTIKAPRIFDSPTPGHYDTPPGYALGWRTSAYKSHRIWAHNGGDDSFGAETRFLPGLKFGVVTFANTANTSNYLGVILSYKLIDDKIGIPQEKREDWRTKMRESWVGFKSGVDQVGGALFPDRPKESLKPALPLESYSGTYFHPAFGELEISAGAPSPSLRQGIELWAIRPTATWGWTIELEHISSEYWLAYAYFTTAPTMVQDAGRLEFKIGADGKVSSLEVAWGFPAPRQTSATKYTFEKIAEK